MSTRVLHIQTAQLQAIEKAARDALPRECCGLLIGTDGDSGWQVSRVEPSPNVAPADRTDRFEIDPVLLIRLQKEFRDTREGMIGVYHSHPNGLAEPSATDLALAWQTGKVWLIAALTGEGAVDMRAFLRTEHAFEPVPISLNSIAA